jgi:urease accessory protein UreF
MLDQSHRAENETSPQGDLHGLAEKIGPVDAMNVLSPGVSEQFLRISTVADLRAFLISYREERLFRSELPVILRAYQHGSRNETRELIELDKEIWNDETVKGLASASRHVGRSQLGRLRPMHDVRLVQKYLGAVETREANGWHTIVYGLVLSLFSLPLRQGLVNYVFQTIQSFVHSANRRIGLSEVACQELIAEITHSTGTAVERILVANGPTVLRLAE